MKPTIRRYVNAALTPKFGMISRSTPAIISCVFGTLYAPIDLAIDVEARTAKVKIGDLIESIGAPIISAFDGSPTRSGISLPSGFEYTYAEMGNGNTTSRAEIKLDLKDSYGQFNVLHMNQDGVIRGR